jgi:hypothetical protein
VSPDKTNYALPIGVAVLAVAGVVFFVAFLRRRHTTDDD